MVLIRVGDYAAVDPSKVVCVQWYRNKLLDEDDHMVDAEGATVHIEYGTGNNLSLLAVRCADDRSAVELYQMVLEAICKEGRPQ